MPSQIFTDQMCDLVKQRMKAIAESNVLINQTLNSASPAQIASHVVLIDQMLAETQSVKDGIDARFDDLKLAENTRCDNLIALLNEFKTRLQNVNL